MGQITKSKFRDIAYSISNSIYEELMTSFDNRTYFKKLREFEYYMEDEDFISSDYGRILVIGDSSFKKTDLINLFEEHGFHKDEIEIEDNYKRVSKYNFHNLRNNYSYRAVFVGPIPHKTKGLEGGRSIIAKMENPSNCYPKTIRLLNESGDLKINKNTVTKAILRLKRNRPTN